MSGIDVYDLHKKLGSKAAEAVLRGVSFGVAAGSCTGLRGATGSGKTTLLRLMAGLDRPDRGKIWLEGRLVDDGKAFFPPMERKIGFVFQSLGLWPHLTVDAHLDYVLASTSWSREACARRKSDVCCAFNLTELMARRPSELSGGEKRLLALARALVGDARVVLLDEPFTGLDGQLKERVMDALAGWLEQHGLTTLLVSHDATDLTRLCRQTVELREGRVVGEDPPADCRTGVSACAANRS